MTVPSTQPAASTTEIARRAEAAARIAENAGRSAMAFFEARDSLVVETKESAQDFVSRADREVEEEIRRAVAAEFPEDGLLGEEYGLETGRSDFVWVIDPIDGTAAFVSGQANWCISIAVKGPDGVVIGVIAAPVFGETFFAVRGGGATLNGRPIAVDPKASLTSGNVAFGATQKSPAATSAAFVQRLYEEGGVLFRIGSGALMLAYVASARLAGYYDPYINAWDCYAGIVLVEEAGGAVDFRGSDDMMTGGPLYAGTAFVTLELRRLAEG